MPNGPALRQPVPCGLTTAEHAPGASEGAVGGRGSSLIATDSGFGAGGFSRTSGSCDSSQAGAALAVEVDGAACAPVSFAASGNTWASAGAVILRMLRCPPLIFHCSAEAAVPPGMETADAGDKEGICPSTRRPAIPEPPARAARKNTMKSFGRYMQSPSGMASISGWPPSAQ